MSLPNYTVLSDRELCDLLKLEDRKAWEFVLEKIIHQEKTSGANSRKRFDWGFKIEDHLGQLYDEMIGGRKLWNWEGGSLVGWMRKYLRGYLNRSNPNGSGRFVDIDGSIANDDGDPGVTVGEKYAKQLSDDCNRNPYGGEDLQVLQHERWEIVQKCFADLWQRNSIQAYVMLLKLRFHMSSVEITERFGMSSVANVDQMFSRAVKKMREVRVNYVD